MLHVTCIKPQYTEVRSSGGTRVVMKDGAPIVAFVPGKGFYKPVRQSSSVSQVAWDYIRKTAKRYRLPAQATVKSDLYEFLC